MYKTAGRVRSEAGEKSGVIGSVFSLIANFIIIMILALCTSVVLEWTGMTFLWKEEGVGHSQRMLDQELEYIRDDLQRSPFGDSPIDISTSVANKTFETLMVKTGYIGLSSKMEVPQSAHDMSILRYSKNIYKASKDYIISAVTITQVFFVRSTIVILSFPLFVLIAFAASVDGLVQRELRKSGGGREYGLVYHSLKSWFKPVLFLPLFVYLASPFPTHPNYVLVPCAIGIGLLIFLLASTFKKYL